MRQRASGAAKRGSASREPHYQPKIDLRTGAVTGTEVVLRWAHPVHGWLPPDEFIPLAEHTGLIVPLTHHVLTHGLRQVAAWRNDGIDLSVAINLSARTLVEPRRRWRPTGATRPSCGARSTWRAASACAWWPRRRIRRRPPSPHHAGL